MEAALDALNKAICTSAEPNEISARELEEFATNAVVALAAGGEGSRLQALTEPRGIHKTTLSTPGGETMIERTIRMYRDAGFHDFVALVFHRARSIADLLGDGSGLGVRVTYSYDPEIPVGRGGAIRNAMENGAIPREKSLVVHNPDDVIVRYEGSFPRDVVATHVAGVRRGAYATAVAVAGSRAAYTGLTIREGVVEEVRPYPFVPIPAHIGVTLFSPEAYDYFFALFDLTKKSDFEGVLFPILARERRLSAVIIPDGCWLAVNDPKALARLTELLQEDQAAAQP